MQWASVLLCLDLSFPKFPPSESETQLQSCWVKINHLINVKILKNLRCPQGTSQSEKIHSLQMLRGGCWHM